MDLQVPAEDGQKFKFEELMAGDVQLMGRVTYEEFAAQVAFGKGRALQPDRLLLHPLIASA